MDAAPPHKSRINLTVTTTFHHLAVILELAEPTTLQLLHVFIAGNQATVWFHNANKKCMKEVMNIWIETEDHQLVRGYIVIVPPNVPSNLMTNAKSNVGFILQLQALQYILSPANKTYVVVTSDTFYGRALIPPPITSYTPLCLTPPPPPVSATPQPAKPSPWIAPPSLNNLRYGVPLDLPEGWRINRTQRKSNPRKFDTTYTSPTGTTYYSKTAVIESLDATFKNRVKEKRQRDRKMKSTILEDQTEAPLTTPTIIPTPATTFAPPTTSTTTSTSFTNGINGPTTTATAPYSEPSSTPLSVNTLKQTTEQFQPIFYQKTLAIQLQYYREQFDMQQKLIQFQQQQQAQQHHIQVQKQQPPQTLAQPSISSHPHPPPSQFPRKPQYTGQHPNLQLSQNPLPPPNAHLQSKTPIVQNPPSQQLPDCYKIMQCSQLKWLRDIIETTTNANKMNSQANNNTSVYNTNTANNSNIYTNTNSGIVNNNINNNINNNMNNNNMNNNTMNPNTNTNINSNNHTKTNIDNTIHSNHNTIIHNSNSNTISNVNPNP